MKKIALLFLYSLLVTASYAQKDREYYPKVGDTIRDYTFGNVMNVGSDEISISDFRGKWLVIDWWSTGCLGCIASFPKMNRLSLIYKDRVEFLMVGLYGKRRTVSDSKRMYTSQQQLHDLKMMAAFDSASFDMFALKAVPLILLVDPAGIIVAKTLSLDSLQISGFLSGNNVSYRYAYSKNEKNLDESYDFGLPLLTSGKLSNGGIDTVSISRSILTKWNPRMPHGTSIGFGDNYTYSKNKDGKYVKMRKEFRIAEAYGLDLVQLIKTAYFKKTTWTPMDSLYLEFNPFLVLEVKDTGLFEWGDPVTGANLYSYSVCFPNFSSERAREVLLDDIERTFNLRTSLQEREVFVWKLVVVDKRRADRLKTQGGLTNYEEEGEYKRIKLSNWALDKFTETSIMQALRVEESKVSDFRYAPVLINETGINFNVDLDLEANFTDLESVRTALKHFGLDIIKGPKIMKSIVVGDNTKNETGKSILSLNVSSKRRVAGR